MFRKNYKDHIKSVHPGKDINNFLLPQDTTRINKELLLPAVSSLSQEMEEAGKMMTKTRPTKLPRIVLLSPDMQRINKDLLLPAEMEEKLMRKTRQKKLVRPSVAGGAQSTPEEGGEDEEAFDHENVEEQFSDSHCPLKYLHQAMKQFRDGKYQDTLILDSC